MIINLPDMGLTRDLARIELVPVFENLVLALAVSFAICMLNIATAGWHGRYSNDLDTDGVQKVHDRIVPRIGGLGVFAGVLAVAAYGFLDTASVLPGTPARTAMLGLLFASIPAFASGSMEDLTKAVSPRARLLCIVGSAALAAWLLAAQLPRLDTWGIDTALAVAPLSIAITLLGVAGVTNSINIIDGFHGVAGITVVIILCGMGVLAWQAGDDVITQLAVAGIGATIGFLILNYPTGRIFLGDGGAYFLGFWIAEIAVLMVVRNPKINAWQILAIYAYPVIEVLFSIYRRKILYGALARAPDRLHLHSLFYRRFARHKFARQQIPWMCNAGVACFVGTWIGSATLCSVLFGDTIQVAVALVLVQVVAYIAVYMRLVRGHWGHCRKLAVVLGLRPQPRRHPLENDLAAAGPHVYS